MPGGNRQHRRLRAQRRGAALFAVVAGAVAPPWIPAPVGAEPAAQAPCPTPAPAGTSWETEAGTGTTPGAGDELGAALTHGDYDNDGMMDLVVGAPGDSVGSQASGALFVYNDPGAPGFVTKITQEAAVAASEGGDRFGASLTTGDFNDDGYADLVAGAPNEAPGSDPAGGTIFVFPGGPDGLGTGTFLTQSSIGDPTEAGDRFGASLAAGDFNDDGADDLAVGMPGEAPASSPAGGAVAIFSGGPSGLGSGQMILQTAVGDPVEAADEFGASLAVGDLNGDGIDDLAMGAPGEAPASSPAGGAVVVLRGAASGLPIGSFHTQASGGGAVEAGDRFGAALAAGDIDADGHDDLVVGAPHEAPGFQPAGGGFSVLPGTASGPGSGYFVAQDVVGDPIEADDRFGEELAVGDLDGDGDADVIVGSPGERTGIGPTSGAVGHLPGGATLSTGRLASPEQLGRDGSAAGRFGEALSIVPAASAGTPGSVLAGAPGDASATGAVNLTRGWTDQSSLGPLVGGVSETTARLWLRTATPTTAQVEYRAAGSGTWSQGPASDTTAATDLTTVIELNGLPQDTEIEYRLVLDCASDVLANGQFRTLPDPDAPSVVRFTYGADINPAYDLTIMDRARQEEPNFMLLGGDQIYADVPPQAPDTKAGYEAKYRTTWGHNEFRRPTASMPTLMMWDDHEIWNDWSAGTSGRYTNARTAFDEYQGSHNPAPVQPGELYFTYRAGGAEMFVLDTRTYRSPNSLDPTDETKTMLGPAQLADLKTWLDTSTAPFKIIVSSVPWGDYGTTGNDSWRGFLAERNDIRNHIRGNEIPGVLVLSGDQHWSGAFRLDDIDNMNLYEFMPTPLATNNRPAPDIAANPEVLHVSDDERVFARFEVDTTVSPAALRVSYITSTGEEIFHTEITQTDINPWESWSRDRFWNADRPLADPAMIYADGSYHSYSTSDRFCFWPTCETYWVPRLTSSSLAVPGSVQGDAMPDLPAWVRPGDRNIWAPSVTRIGQDYIMYFTATSDASGMKCIGTATASTPAGPFAPAPTPLRCTPGFWNIDPHVVHDGSDLYLLWRADDAANVTGKVVGAQLAPDGLSFAGAPQVTLLVGEYPWEDGYPDGEASEPGAMAAPSPSDRRLPGYANEGDGLVASPGIGPIENPAMAQHPTSGDWLLTWSANRWETQDYATGLATCAGPLGPCTRVSTDTPWLRTTDPPSAIDTSAEFGGIGGLSFVTGADGQLYAVMHGYRRDGSHATGQKRIGWVYRVDSAGGHHLVEFDG